MIVLELYFKLRNLRFKPLLNTVVRRSFARLHFSNFDSVLKLNLFGLSLLPFFCVAQIFLPTLLRSNWILHWMVLVLLLVFVFAVYHLDTLNVVLQCFKFKKLRLYTHEQVFISLKHCLKAFWSFCLQPIDRQHS